MPDRMGNFHLPTCIKIVALAKTKQEAHSLLSVELPEINLRNRFIESFWHLRSLYLASKNEELSCHAIDFLKLNSFRLNANNSSLYAYNLNSAIDKAISSGENLQLFITNLVRQNTQLTQDPCDGVIRIDLPNDVRIVGTEDGGIKLNEKQIPFSALAQVFPDLFTLSIGIR